MLFSKLLKNPIESKKIRGNETKILKNKRKQTNKSGQTFYSLINISNSQLIK